MSVTLTTKKISALFTADLFSYLKTLRVEHGEPFYAAGGTVRDLLLERQPEDIDLTVARSAVSLAEQLAQRTGGAFVPLGRDNDAARAVFKGNIVDFSSFRDGAGTIEEELGLRDITINSLGVCLDPLFDLNGNGVPETVPVLDPAGGLDDLQSKQIKVTFVKAFEHDPLRLLRVYRFAAMTGFAIDNNTLRLGREQASLIHNVTSERIGHELDLIMRTDLAGPIFTIMAENDILWELIPELKCGVGMKQPASHHLDVFHHSLEALVQMEHLLSEGCFGFTKEYSALKCFSGVENNRVNLKWAALLHDIGKPVKHSIDEDRNNKITFYNHDRAGGDIVESISERFRWSLNSTGQVIKLVQSHMWPFHLANVARRETVSTKACIRLVKSMGAELAGLFLLAMADARAGCGDGRPMLVEQELSSLYECIETVRTKNVVPVLEGGPLLTGKDLISQLKLTPGPIFKVILQGVEEAQMEKKINTEVEAFDLAVKIADEYIKDE